MGQDQSSVFDLAAVATQAASMGTTTRCCLGAIHWRSAEAEVAMPYSKYAAYDKQIV